MAGMDSYGTISSPADADWLLGADVSAGNTARLLLSVLRTFVGRSAPISETAHGFSVGDLVYFDGTNWAQSNATTEQLAEYTGMVVTVPDADTFTLQQTGFVSGLSGLTAGSRYYLQDDGSLGTDPGTVEALVLQATSTTAGYLQVESVSRAQVLVLDVSRDETTDLTTGTGKYRMRAPFAMEILDVKASLSDAPTASAAQFDVNEAGTSILSTEITIDASETTSSTAATPPVISDGAIANDAEITIDVDAIGGGNAGKGLKVYLYYRPA